MKRILRILMYLVPAIFLIGVIAIAWYQRERHVSFFSDADSIRAPMGQITPRDVLWQPAIRLPGVLNTAGNEYEPSVTRDGQTLFFVRGRAAHNADIFFSTQTVDGWSEPRPLLAINTPADELGPEPSPDGSELYFYSDRVGGLGGYDLWRAQRTEDGWSAPVNLGPAVNSRDHDYGPCLSPDGASLYFASDRLKPSDQETTQDVESGFAPSIPTEPRDYDLYVAHRSEDAFGDVVAVVELNSPANEGSPAFSASSDFLYFTSDRPGGSGGFDLYRARSVHGEFRSPTNLGDSINSEANELDPSLTLGGFGLHFSSDRVVMGTDPKMGQTYDLYYAQSREVFAETESYRARIDWAALLAVILPHLIWLLLILSMLGLLTAVLKRFEYNRMGLLTRCLVGSLIAHVLLLALLTLWGVSTKLSDAITSGSSTRVVLYSPSVGNGIAEQIQGELTNLEFEAESERIEQQTFEMEAIEPQFDEARQAIEHSSIESLESLDSSQTLEDARAQAMETPDVSPVEQIEQVLEVDHTMPPEALREQVSEALTRVPDQAIDYPTIDRALDEAFPTPDQPFESLVAMSVERSEVMNEIVESMADQHEMTEVSSFESSDTLMTMSPTEVALRDVPDVPLPLVPETKTAQSPEAETQIVAARSNLQRQDTSDRVPPREDRREIVELSMQPVSEQLSMQSMALQVDARTSTAESAMTPPTMDRALPHSPLTDFALRSMPRPRADMQSESQQHIAVAVAPTGRTDATERLESVGAPAQEMEVNPQASRLVASDSLAHAMNVSDIAVRVSPMPQMHALSDRMIEPVSDLALSMLSTDLGTRVSTIEAQRQLPAAPSKVHRLESLNVSFSVPTQLQEVTPQTESSPLEVTASSLASSEVPEIQEMETKHPVFSPAASLAAVHNQDSLSLDLPGEREQGRARASANGERSLAPFMATSRATASRPALNLPDSESPALKSQVDVAPSANVRPLETRSFVNRENRDSSRHATQTLQLDAAQSLNLTPTDTFALNLPSEREQSVERSWTQASPAGRPFDEPRVSRYRPSESPMFNAAPVTVAMNPSTTPQESASSSLLEDTFIADDGVSPSLSPPLDSHEDSEGIVIPPLAAVHLPGMEETSRHDQQDVSRESAVDIAQHGMSDRFNEDFHATPTRDGSEPMLDALPPATDLTIHEDQLFAGLTFPGETTDLVRDLALPMLDHSRIRTLDTPGLFSLDLDLNLPLEQHAPIDPYLQRAPEIRDSMVEIMGGSRETEQAVKLALDWLARHQSLDGSWDGDNFDDDCHECEGIAKVHVDVGLTGLALLCFLAADHTHLEEGPYRDTVLRGLQWLQRKQRRDGSMLANESLYSHGIATIALAEAYGMTGDPDLAQSVQRAVDFIFAARNRGVGGWRYGPGQIGDTSVLGWQIMALKSAERAGTDVPDEAFEIGRRWIDLVSQSTPSGLYRYQPDGEVTSAMVAEGMFVRQLLGTSPGEPSLQDSADYILDRMPDWDDECNVYFWYYATLALFQHQGEAWEKWNERVKDVLIEHQHTSGRISGSWDPDGRWAGIGGRVYQTAISTLILEVYYRYLPSFVGDASGSVRSAITGRVTDAFSGEPIPGAMIRLDLSEGRSVNAQVDDRGRYTLLVPDIPDFIAISASHKGYLPETINVAEDEVKNHSIVRDFELQPMRTDTIAVELDPEVHHLGNDEFTGRINSQFQKDSEGLVYSMTFSLEASQLDDASRQAEILLLVRGAQADNPITINGQLVLKRIDRAPRDGSFGEFRTAFPVSWLHPGENTIEIRSVRGSSDLDDFEFVNIRIVLNPEDEDQ